MEFLAKYSWYTFGLWSGRWGLRGKDFRCEWAKDFEFVFLGRFWVLVSVSQREIERERERDGRKWREGGGGFKSNHASLTLITSPSIVFALPFSCAEVLSLSLFNIQCQQHNLLTENIIYIKYKTLFVFMNCCETCEIWFILFLLFIFIYGGVIRSWVGWEIFTTPDKHHVAYWWFGIFYNWLIELTELIERPDQTRRFLWVHLSVHASSAPNSLF